MELGGYVAALRRRWRLVVTALLTCVTLGALSVAAAVPQYQAMSQVFVSTSGGDSVTDLAQGSSFTQRQVTTYVDLVTTPVVLEPVINELGLETTSSELAAQVSALNPSGTVLVNITATDSDPQFAAQVANAVSAQFSETVQELERVESDAASPVKVTVVRAASEASDPSSPNLPRTMILATVLGLLFGLGLAVLRDLLDTRINGPEDISRVTNRTVIGTIAFDKTAERTPLIVQVSPHAPRAEAFRTLRTNLQFINVTEQPRSIVFTSSLPSEGKTTTTANLALTLAASGSSVVVVEGDLRRPRLLDYMGMEGSIGLTTVLIGEAELQDVLQPFNNKLTVLGAGAIPPNPSELLGSAAMGTLLRTLEAQFDYVIVDAPPLLPVTDAAVLSKIADGTIVVVGSKIIKREHLAKALGTLETVGAHILGIVINRLPVGTGDSYRYYREGYAAEVHASEKPHPRSRRRESTPTT